jgi:hypothetical protein
MATATPELTLTRLKMLTFGRTIDDHSRSRSLATAPGQRASRWRRYRPAKPAAGTRPLQKSPGSERNRDPTFSTQSVIVERNSAQLLRRSKEQAKILVPRAIWQHKPGIAVCYRTAAARPSCWISLAQMRGSATTIEEQSTVRWASPRQWHDRYGQTSIHNRRRLS